MRVFGRTPLGEKRRGGGSTITTHNDETTMMYSAGSIPSDQQAKRQEQKLQSTTTMDDAFTEEDDAYLAYDNQDDTEYGYEEVLAAYGYEEASPSTTSRPTPRRSSLKTSGLPRRASISYTGEVEVKLRDNTIVKRRTSISFTDHDDVREVEPARSLAERPDALWTTDLDYRRSREEARHLINAVKRFPHRPVSSDACVRGLECHLRDDKTHAMSRNLVLNVQRNQRTVGLVCDETLGKVYGHLTAESAARAAARGEADHAEVKQEHRLTKRLMNRMFRRSSM